MYNWTGGKLKAAQGKDEKKSKISSFFQSRERYHSPVSQNFNAKPNVIKFEKSPVRKRKKARNSASAVSLDIASLLDFPKEEVSPGKSNRDSSREFVKPRRKKKKHFDGTERGSKHGMNETVDSKQTKPNDHSIFFYNDGEDVTNQ